MVLLGAPDAVGICRQIVSIARYHLVPVLTAAQNVELPLLLFKMSGSERRERVRELLHLINTGQLAPPIAGERDAGSGTLK